MKLLLLGIIFIKIGYIYSNDNVEGVNHEFTIMFNIFLAGKEYNIL